MNSKHTVTSKLVLTHTPNLFILKVQHLVRDVHFLPTNKTEVLVSLAGCGGPLTDWNHLMQNAVVVVFL